jgi:Putative inner membrane protein (DUF1819)
VTGRADCGQRDLDGDFLVAESVSGSRNVKLPVSLGFRDGRASVHTSRTMMLSELSIVLEQVAAGAKADEYLAAVVGENILGKPTQTTRNRTAQRLVELYALDRNRAVFRLLRHFWAADASARPLLAYLAAAARDPMLRDTSPFVLAFPLHTVLDASQVADRLKESYPERFKPTTLLSTAQNLASTWTQAGYLTGKLNKKRSRPVATPVAAAYALILGYLCGMRGKMLLDTSWTRMLDRSPAQIVDLAAEASRQGWLSYKGAGSVVEIGFPGLLTTQEEKASHDPD